MNNLTEFSTSLAATLIGAKQTVAVAESSTAGLISACLLAVPGASAFFKGGCVIYTLESRKQLLRISRDDVEGLKPLTQAMVMKFAAKAREQLGATWGIAELGAAGPAGTPYGHHSGYFRYWCIALQARYDARRFSHLDKKLQIECHLVSLLTAT